jgi:hypothetical protein
MAKDSDLNELLAVLLSDVNVSECQTAGDLSAVLTRSIDSMYPGLRIEAADDGNGAFSLKLVLPGV